MHRWAWLSLSVLICAFSIGLPPHALQAQEARAATQIKFFLPWQPDGTLNPALQVLIAHGLTDLITPYFASRYLVDQLPPLAGAAPIELRLYGGGHMMYMRPESRRALKADARALYERALARRRSGATAH